MTRRLVGIVEARANLSVRRVFADREFHAADVVTALEQRNLFYVIPTKRDDRVKRFIARIDDEVTVKDEHRFYGPVKDGRSETRVETMLVGLPPAEDHDGQQVFLTNLAVEVITLTPEYPRGRVDLAHNVAHTLALSTNPRCEKRSPKSFGAYSSVALITPGDDRDRPH